MGDSRGLILGFGGIAPVAAPEWSKWDYNVNARLIELSSAVDVFQKEFS
jgi:hypothetical protein